MYHHCPLQKELVEVLKRLLVYLFPSPGSHSKFLGGSAERSAASPVPASAKPKQLASHDPSCIPGKNSPDVIWSSGALDDQGLVRVVVCQHGPLQKEFFENLKRLPVPLPPNPGNLFSRRSR